MNTDTSLVRCSVWLRSCEARRARRLKSEAATTPPAGPSSTHPLGLTLESITLPRHVETKDVNNYFLYRTGVYASKGEGRGVGEGCGLFTLLSVTSSSNAQLL